MHRSLFVAFAVLTLPALAAQPDLKKLSADINAADQKSCGEVRENLKKHADLCADELKAMEPIDCAVTEARHKVKHLTLNADCARKVARAAKDSAHAPVPCKALDENGAVVAEGISKDNYLHCAEALKEPLEARCSNAKPGAMLKYTMQSTFMGQEKVSKGTTLCPRPK